MEAPPPNPEGQTPTQMYPKWLPKFPYIVYRCVIEQTFEPLHTWFWGEVRSMKSGWELFLLLMIGVVWGVHRWDMRSLANTTPAATLQAANASSIPANSFVEERELATHAYERAKTCRDAGDVLGATTNFQEAYVHYFNMARFDRSSWRLVARGAGDLMDIYQAAHRAQDAMFCVTVQQSLDKTPPDTQPATALYAKLNK